MPDPPISPIFIHGPQNLPGGAHPTYLSIGILTLQRNIYVIKFGQSDPSFSVRLIGNQITMKVIFNNLHYPLHTQRSERKYY